MKSTRVSTKNGYTYWMGTTDGEHLPVLQVVIPLVLAPFCFVMPRYTWIVALTGSALSLICSVLLLSLIHI